MKKLIILLTLLAVAGCNPSIKTDSENSTNTDNSINNTGDNAVPEYCKRCDSVGGLIEFSAEIGCEANEETGEVDCVDANVTPYQCYTLQDCAYKPKHCFDCLRTCEGYENVDPNCADWENTCLEELNCGQ